MHRAGANRASDARNRHQLRQRCSVMQLDRLDQRLDSLLIAVGRLQGRTDEHTRTLARLHDAERQSKTTSQSTASRCSRCVFSDPEARSRAQPHWRSCRHGSKWPRRKLCPRVVAALPLNVLLRPPGNESAFEASPVRGRCAYRGWKPGFPQPPHPFLVRQPLSRKPGLGGPLHLRCALPAVRTAPLVFHGFRNAVVRGLRPRGDPRRLALEVARLDERRDAFSPAQRALHRLLSRDHAGNGSVPDAMREK